jgi:hypothetical protein
MLINNYNNLNYLNSKQFSVMESVTIIGRIGKTKKAEFFQAMEPLKKLVKDYCKDFKVEVEEDNNLNILITFKNKGDVKEYFNNKEFNILKGSIKSLCNNVNIKLNE